MASTASQQLPEDLSTLHTTKNNQENAAEMTNLETSTEPSTGLLNDVSIPSGSMATSPITDSFNKETLQSGTVSSTITSPAATSADANTSTSAATTVPPLNNATENAAASDSRPAELSRLDSVAIGPSTDTTPAIPTVDSTNPVCIITLLLTSGARHPYKLDEKYLTKRNVEVPGLTEAGKKDPFSISVYTLKELILREWREEWEVKPSSPSSIRLIHFGRLLDDKTPLKECRFNAETPNVVHMTVKPQDIVDDEEATKGKTGTRDREGNESTPGCRCVIM